MRFKRKKETGYEIKRPPLGAPIARLGVVVPASWIPQIDRLIRVSQDLNPDNPYRSRSDLVRRVLADTLELDG